MAGPYTCNDMLVTVDGTSVGVVTGLDISLAYEGGTVQHVYGSRGGYLSHGGKRATFRLQRWFMTDTDTDLLFDLFDLRLPFTVSGELSGVGSSTLTLSNCKANTWRLITGDANSIVGEEVSGEGVGWSGTTI